MNILISNDDGYNSEGIIALANVLSTNHRVIVVAPKHNMSATSQSLSIRKKLTFEKVEGDTSYESYTLSGTPADCVKFSVYHFKHIKFDLVCSGINNGSNLGSDTNYSGTVGIALEAQLFGIPAISFSNISHGNNLFAENAKCIDKLFDKLYSICCQGGVLNVNFPNINANQIKGVKLCNLSIACFHDWYESLNDSTCDFELTGYQREPRPGERTDLYWVKNDYISVTPLLYDRTDYTVLNKFKDLEF